MIIKNETPIKLIGYSESSFTQMMMESFLSEDSYLDISVITPEDFFEIINKNDYQYFVAFSIDWELRKNVCKFIDDNNLNCVSLIHDTSVIYSNVKIGKGCALLPYSRVAHDTVIGDHSVIEGCIVAHHVSLGKNCILRMGTAIGGRTNIGDNCVFNMRSGVINKVNIVSDVTLGAFSNLTKDATKPGKYIGTIARYVKEE